MNVLPVPHSVTVAGERPQITPHHFDQPEVGVLGQAGQAETLDLAGHDLQVSEVGERGLASSDEAEPGEVGAAESVGVRLVAAEAGLCLS